MGRRREGNEREMRGERRGEEKGEERIGEERKAWMESYVWRSCGTKRMVEWE